MPTFAFVPIITIIAATNTTVNCGKSFVDAPCFYPIHFQSAVV